MLMTANVGVSTRLMYSRYGLLHDTLQLYRIAATPSEANWPLRPSTLETAAADRAWTPRADGVEVDPVRLCAVEILTLSNTSVVEGPHDYRLPCDPAAAARW